EVGKALSVSASERSAAQKKVIADHYAALDERLIQLNKALASHKKQEPTLSKAQTLALGSARKTHVLVRGDFLRPGAEVSPGTPVVLSSLKTHGLQPVGLTRLDLARWLMEPSHPLTARVLVNWTWQKYFGRGLVATLEDFGTQGEKPS